MSRWHRKVDASQKGIEATLRKMGASVHRTTEVGGGFPDAVVGYRGRTHLVECKTGNAKETGKKKRETAGRQKRFADDWAGAPVIRLRSELEAEQWIRLLGGDVSGA